MSEPQIFRIVILGLFLAAGATFFIAGRITAPYGRHRRSGFGPSLPWKVGWILMESPSVLLFGALFWSGQSSGRWVPWLLAAFWLTHYVHRALVYPLQTRGTNRSIPIAVLAAGFAFNVANSYVNARALVAFGPDYPLSWLLSFRFLYGLLLFVSGFIINRWSDVALTRLREPGETNYKIPRGGLFEEISCPNYLGEVVQWIGWAFMTWSSAGLAFATFTAANLIPRAVSHHNWYRRNFPAYPRRRKAIIPHIL